MYAFYHSNPICFSFEKIKSSQNPCSLKDFVHHDLISLVWNVKVMLSIYNIDYMITFMLFRSILPPFIKCQYLPTGGEVVEAHAFSFFCTMLFWIFCQWKISTLNGHKLTNPEELQKCRAIWYLSPFGGWWYIAGLQNLL